MWKNLFYPLILASFLPFVDSYGGCRPNLRKKGQGMSRFLKMHFALCFTHLKRILFSYIFLLSVKAKKTVYFEDALGTKTSWFLNENGLLQKQELSVFFSFVMS